MTEFEGSIEELFRDQVGAVCLQPDCVLRFHELLRRYLLTADPAFVVRGSSSMRRETLRTRNGLTILPSDNAPAWWVHHMLWNGIPLDDDSFGDAIKGCPRHFHDVSKRRENGINMAGWYVAHILPAKFGNPNPEVWTREEAVAKFIRNFHPANHFYVPGGRAVGEDRRVIAYAARRSAERCAGVWGEMVSWSGPQAREYLDGLPAVTGKEHIRFLTSLKLIKEERAAEHRSLGPAVVEYRATRLHFRGEFIEPLGLDDAFRIVTPVGTFEMTKRDFYEVFANVTASVSYRTGSKHYHYPSMPSKAIRFRK